MIGVSKLSSRGRLLYLVRGGTSLIAGKRSGVTTASEAFFAFDLRGENRLRETSLAAANAVTPPLLLCPCLSLVGGERKSSY